jgi:hypothetical protein
MKATQVIVAPITCNLSNLTVFTTEPNAEYPDSILQQDEAFSLQVTVELAGPGAIALVPLCLSVQVNFYAEPFGIGSKLDLGETSVETAAKVLTYTPTLTLDAPAKVGLVLEEIYQITAVLRIGAKNSPALITGVIEGLAIQTY